MKLLLIFIIAFALLSVGCTDSDKTRAQGAGAGAVVGGLLGYVIGGKRGAAIGAAVGVGVGLAVGDAIAKRKEKYANTEKMLEGEIAHSSNELYALQQANAQLEQDIAQLEREIASLKAKHAKTGAEKKALRKKKQEVDFKHKKASNALAAVEKEYEIEKGLLEEAKKDKTADSGKIRTYEKSISALEKEKAILETHVEELSAMGASISI